MGAGIAAQCYAGELGQLFWIHSQLEETPVQTHLMKCAAFGAVSMLLAGAAQAAGVPGQGTWESTLLGRDIDGHAVDAASDRAVFLFDKILHVTWLRDANVNGVMDWKTAKSWADTLAIGTYDDWRLPAVIDTGAPGCDWNHGGDGDCGLYVKTKSGDPTKYQAGQTVYSEMAHLFYVTLGNKPLGGLSLTNTATFENLQSYAYWSGQRYAAQGGTMWKFETDWGAQGAASWRAPYFALAVRDGDVLAVPEPQTYAMLLLGLGATLLAVRRQPR